MSIFFSNSNRSVSRSCSLTAVFSVRINTIFSISSFLKRLRMRTSPAPEPFQTKKMPVSMDEINRATDAVPQLTYTNNNNFTNNNSKSTYFFNLDENVEGITFLGKYYES